MSFGCKTEGRTAASTTAAKTAFGVGASNADGPGAASASVAAPATRPAMGEEAPAIWATSDLLNEPPTGALPATPETTQPKPCPNSSGPRGPDSTTDTIARKSTPANATADAIAPSQPPKRSAKRAQGMSHGSCRTQPVSAELASSEAELLDAPDAPDGIFPTTLPLYPIRIASKVPTTVAAMTSKPAMGLDTRRKVRKLTTFPKWLLHFITMAKASADSSPVSRSQSQGCNNIQQSLYMAAEPPEIGSAAPLSTQGSAHLGSRQF
mmetsp:Transcript_51455/g.147549  ORF Transcript_51455/g.147549 Transcript_51455/m.147549 type:complete len:266 (+) Transcript_51455:186-983(+)